MCSWLFHKKNMAMTDIEKIKRELEEYKIENHTLRLNNDKIKNTVSYRLGNVLISGFKGYRQFIMLPYALYKLRQEIRGRKQKKEQKSKNKSLVLSQHSFFILRDAVVSSHIMTEQGEVNLLGHIQVEENEKQNAALLIFKVSGESNKELANKIGASWSEKVGMYHYLPTNNGPCDFSLQLKNIPAGRLEVAARRWHSKGLVKISGALTIQEEASSEDKLRQSGIIEKYTIFYHKNSVYDFIIALNKDNSLTEMDRGIVLSNILKGLTAKDRSSIQSLVTEIIKCSMPPEQVHTVCQHLYNEGCYRETHTLYTHFKSGLDSYKRKFITDIIGILDNGLDVPNKSARKLAASSNNINYLIHCSLPHHSNGYATRSHSVLTSLNTLGIDITGITRPGYPWDVRFSSPPSDDPHHVIDNVNYHHLSGPVQRELTISEYIDHASRVIESNTINNGAKYIHACSNYLNAFPALFAARRLGIPFIYEVRGFWEITESSRKLGWENSDKYQVDKQLETLLVQSADVVITLTEAMKAEIVSRGVQADRIFVAPNAVDLDKFVAQPMNLELKTELGLHEELTIGYVGSIVDYEGLDDLLIASSQLIKAGYRFNVLIIGDGGALPGLKKLAKDLDIEHCVKFTGRIPHESVVDYYSIIDITPFPRKSLTVCELVSPLKPFEAMALSKCIIASDVQAIKEFIIEGENGLLFEKGNIASLKDGLSKLLTDQKLRQHLATSAKAWVSEQRTWKRTGLVFKSAYDFIDKQKLISHEDGDLLPLKQHATYYLGKEAYIDIAEKPHTSFVVEGNTRYILNGKCNISHARSALVQLKLSPDVSKEMYVTLGYHWSERMGAYRYIPVHNDGNYCIPFKTAKNSLFASITIHPWGKGAEKILHHNAVNIEKNYNNKTAAISAITSMGSCKNIAIYGDVNTNLIDGAAIWLISLAKTLAKIERINVFVFLKDKIKSTEVIDDAYKFDNIYLIEPDKGPMKPETVVNTFKNFEEEHGCFDAVIVRGSDVCKALADAGSLDGRLIPYLTDIPQSTELLTVEWKNKIDDIIYSAGHVLCQTSELSDFFALNFPSATTSLLPPMVPARLTGRRIEDSQKQVLIYAGKFAPEWGIRELFSTYRKLQEVFPKLELHIYGDKIHNPKDDPGFYQETLQQLSSGNGIVWHGRAARQQVLNALLSADLAWAWRHDSLEQHTKELSTKLLEYGLAKIPVLLNRSPLYEKLLGSNFELFARNQQELEQRARFALMLKKTKRLTAPLENLVKQHSFEHVAVKHLQPMLEKFPVRNKSVILLAGHDLKFFTHLEATFKQQGFTVLVDRWLGHNKHNEQRSKALLSRADIVICEWALGNAVWYSSHLQAHQKLHIRVHGQEVNLEYFSKMDFSKISSINFVSQHLLDDGLLKQPMIPREKCHVIPNYVLCEKLDRPKLDGAEFNIGLIGIVPKMKRLDKALDILEEVRKKDSRYRLFIKGKKPEEYSWMKNRPGEMAFYHEQYSRIDNSKWLKGAVFFDGFGSDMATWYQKIGYVLSTSEHESFHLSVADGAASGSIPKIIEWPGSRSLYGNEWNFCSVSQCAESFFSTSSTLENGKVLHFDINKISACWLNKL